MLPLADVVFAVTMLASAPPQAPATSAGASQPAAQTQPDTSSAPDDQAGGSLPVSLDHIRQKLSEPPAINVNTQGNVFRVEVVGRKLTIEDILGPDYLKGPTPAGAPTHQEFLDLVTPKDVQGYAAFNNGEAATVAATSFALAWALQKAIHKVQDAKEEREREAARKEVQEALAELEKARVKAGLPPK